MADIGFAVTGGYDNPTQIHVAEEPDEPGFLTFMVTDEDGTTIAITMTHFEATLLSAAIGHLLGLASEPPKNTPDHGIEFRHADSGGLNPDDVTAAVERWRKRYGRSRIA